MASKEAGADKRRKSWKSSLPYLIAASTQPLRPQDIYTKPETLKLGSTSRLNLIDRPFHFRQPLLDFGTIFIANMSNADPLVTIK